MISIETLEGFEDWMNKNDHYPTMFDDYGGPSMECSQRKCNASMYDWTSYHVAHYVELMTGVAL